MIVSLLRLQEGVLYSYTDASLFDLRIRPSHCLDSIMVTDGDKSPKGEVNNSLPGVTMELPFTD